MKHFTLTHLMVLCIASLCIMFGYGALNEAGIIFGVAVAAMIMILGEILGFIVSPEGERVAKMLNGLRLSPHDWTWSKESGIVGNPTEEMYYDTTCDTFLDRDGVVRLSAIHAWLVGCRIDSWKVQQGIRKV